MLILGIETSCDETALALVRYHQEGKGEILSEVLSSQIKVHQEYGGVVPEIAAREHMTALPLLLEQVMNEGDVGEEDIDGIAVTSGPGLKGCLLTGICFAKGLSLGWKKPLYGTNHIEGHVLVTLLDNPELTFPHLTLIVSGGHTELQIVKGFGNYECIARTIDDAAGEAFDKSAHLLGFPYPGGAKLAALADAQQRSNFILPKVMREAEGFSFSGLKTAIWQLVNREAKEMNEAKKGEISYAVQEAIIDALIYKLKKAVKETNIQTLSLTGGVAANKALRKAISAIEGTKVFFPKLEHCTDNGAMIAYAAGYRAFKNQRDSFQLEVRPRWPLESLCG